MVYIQIIFTVLIIAHAAVTTSFWANTIRAFSAEGKTYAQRRVALAFGGFPIDQVHERLNTLLPADAPIALGPKLLKDDFLKQRLTEGLYPHPIDRTAQHILDLIEASAFDPKQNQEITRLDPGLHILVRNAGPGLDMLVLNGPMKQTHLQRVNETYEFSIVLWAAAITAAFGFGAAALIGISKIFHQEDQIRTAVFLLLSIILGSVIIGLLMSFATWVQLPLPWLPLSILGLVLALAVAVHCCLIDQFKRFKHTRTTMRQIFTSFETGLVFLFVGIFAIRMLQTPITLWDGRSIWFFHAKQIYWHGMFAKVDAIHPDSQWSHNMYPLLMPAWLAHFTGLAGAYNERMASMGIPVLFGAGFSLLWQFARHTLGRIFGTTFTIVLFLTLADLTLGGYVDGFVALFLSLEFLALASPELKWSSQITGWTSAICASLLKQEGLVLAIVLTALIIGFRPELRAKTVKQKLSVFIIFLPAVTHVIWSSLLGLKGDFHGIRWAEVFENFSSRWEVIFYASIASMGHYSILWEGFAGLIVFVFSAFTYRLHCYIIWQFRLISMIGITFLSCVCIIFFLTPQDLHWHVSTALDRLLLHPATFFVLLPFLGPLQYRHSFRLWMARQ